MSFSDLKYLVTQTFKEWSEDKVSRLAAAMAYYTVFSIAPLLVLTLIVATQFFDTDTARIAIEEQIRSLIGGPGAQVISEIMTNASGPTGGVLATVISIATLIFGASGVFSQLQDTLNTIWDVQPNPNRGLMDTIKARFLSFTMVVGVGFLLLVSLIVSTAVAGLNEMMAGIGPGMEIVARILSLLISIIIMTGLFAAMYKVVPDVEIKWRDVFIGALVTAVLFAIGEWLIGAYLGNAATNSAFGAFGSLIALLAWVYYSAQIVFLGAEFTQVYANHYNANTTLNPSAVPLTAKTRIQQGIPPAETGEPRARKKVATHIVYPPAVRQTAYQLQNDQQVNSPATTAGKSRIFLYSVIIIVALSVAIWLWHVGSKSNTEPERSFEEEF